MLFLNLLTFRTILKYPVKELFFSDSLLPPNFICFWLIQSFEVQVDWIYAGADVLESILMVTVYSFVYVAHFNTNVR